MHQRMKGYALPTVCGRFCDRCMYFPKRCPGCQEIAGRAFWTGFVGIEQCPIYHCCVLEKRLPQCGYCNEIVCHEQSRFRDRV